PRTQDGFEFGEAEREAAQWEEGPMDLGGALVADAESGMLVQPRHGAFDDPARRAQAAGVHFLAGATILGDDRLDVADPHRHAVAMRAIAAVGLDGLGPSAR